MEEEEEGEEEEEEEGGKEEEEDEIPVTKDIDFLDQSIRDTWPQLTTPFNSYFVF